MFVLKRCFQLTIKIKQNTNHNKNHVFLLFEKEKKKYIYEKFTDNSINSYPLSDGMQRDSDVPLLQQWRGKIYISILHHFTQALARKVMILGNDVLRTCCIHLIISQLCNHSLSR